MYIPVDRETCLRLPSIEGVPAKRPVVAIASNREKTFIATATEDALYIWLANPQLLLCVLSLSESDIAEKGKLRKIYWRYDSSAIAVITSTNHILIYRVDISEENVYNLTDNSRYRRSAQELFLRGHRPSISLFPAVIVNLAAPATCCVPLREELFVCVKNGYSHHISWEGAVRTDFSIRLASVPFAHDQLQSKPEYINDSTTHVVDAVYAPLIGGYCIVLSDGRAALLTSSDPRFHPNSLLGVWVNNIKDALCTDVNHKFRLLMFGCSNGEIAAFHLDDTNGSLVQTFRVPPSVIDGPEISSCSLACTRVTVLPNGSAFAAVWCNLPSEETKVLPPTAAIFSPFGAQLWCSLEGVTDLDGPSSLAYTTVEWGTEGYQLWLGRTDGLGLQLLVRFAAACNPVMEHHDRVVLLSSSNVLISPPRDREPAASAPHAVWMPITYPNEYISANWPIRFASLDVEGKVLAVAGSRGLAHCNISTGRWKIFGNESQERDIYVTGGIVVWNGAVVVACSENDNTKELLRFYPVSTKLDNRFASVMDTECRVLQMNLRDDALVTFDVECRILLYKLNRTDDPKVADSYAQVSLDRIAEIRVGDLIPHAACLVSLQLTHLNLDTGGGTFIPGVDTVLVNVSGKLITLSPKKSAINDEERFQLNQPIMVASFVEQIWHDRMRTAGVIPVDETAILSNALWINCGSKGMRVWLPLLPGRKAAQNAQESSFISKRIMLPYELGIYPVVIYSADCLAVGVETVRMQLNLHGGKRLSYYNLHRNSEIFVHHLLRQLLKRNLGMFALEVAGACRRLPYFSHSLELLLHGVLEEEATSSEPIPDPLLPRCVAFIREFPEYLRTVAHCSRKTELALWPALFSVTGSPNDLFETCMRDGQLQTAASYLIVLQSMEHSQVSQEQSLRLLREALSAGEWTIARDIVRFANSIDADDMDSPARSPVSLHQARRTTSISLNNGEANEFVFSRFQSAASKVSKVRHSHDHKDGLRKDSTGSGKKVSRAMSNEMSPPSPSAVLNPLAEKIEAILIEHGQHLLDDFCIRDLGSFCTHLTVNTQRLMSRHAVNDFPLALTRLHSQFSWPYPVPGKHVVDQLEKKLGAMTTSKSTCSLNGSVNGELIRTSALIPKTPEDGVKRSRSPAISEGEESCSIKEAKLLPLGTDISPPMNGRQSPDSLATLPAPETPTTRSTNADWQGVDVLVGEATSKGPSISQLQLAVMLQFFSEACSIDWVFLLCLVSRDVSRLRKEINAGVINKWGLDSFGQLRLGCLSLLKWAAANCLGYVSILQVFHAHLEMAAEQAGIQNLPPTTAAVQERVSRKPEKSPVPLANGSIKQPALREAFQGRERSRSVDRLATTSSSATDEESEGCNIM